MLSDRKEALIEIIEWYRDEWHRQDWCHSDLIAQIKAIDEVDDEDQLEIIEKIVDGWLDCGE